MDEKQNKGNDRLDWGFGILMFTVLAIGFVVVYVDVVWICEAGREWFADATELTRELH